MVKINPGVEWAFVNCSALRETNSATGEKFGNIPFCYEKTKKALGYDKVPDSFPVNGVEKLLPDCSDLKDVLVTAEDHKLWAEFFDRCSVHGVGTRDRFAKEISAARYKPHRDLMSKWFNNIRKRWTMTKTVDDVIAKLNIHLWRVYESVGVDFPPARRGTAAGNNVSVASRLNLIDSRFPRENATNTNPRSPTKNGMHIWMNS